jgi:hypothetical protein
MTANRVADKLVASISNRRTQAVPPTTRSDARVVSGRHTEDNLVAGKQWNYKKKLE